MKPVLTIQIPTYQNLDQLCTTLTTLVMYNDFPFKIVVINNDGSEESESNIDAVIARYPVANISVIHAKGNKGWMGAHNLALKSCDTPFVCLLNDDVVFLQGISWFWRNLIQWFVDDKVGAVGPASNFVMGAQNIWALDVETISETTLLIGFCVVMRTDLLKQIGGLDESLPGGDDLDWSIRIRNAGYKLLIDRSCFLYHIGQQTGRRVKPGYWDSELHQERTNNALVHKHGIAKWYDTLCARHWKYGASHKDLFKEHDWYGGFAEKHKGQKGINLGGGHTRYDGIPNLDLSATGERGAGGRKFTGAVTDIVADATDIPVKDESQDFLFAAHLFEHLIDPVQALNEWRRVLKPGGILYASLPDHDKISTMLIDHTHVHAFVPESARNLFESLGWKVTFCEKFNPSIGFGLIAERPA